MYKKRPIPFPLAISCLLCILLTGNVQAADTPLETGGYAIHDIAADLQDDSLLIILQGDRAPAYTMYELYSPKRLVIDIAEVSLAPTIDLARIIPKNSFASLKITSLDDKNPQITRFEITLAEDHSSQVNRLDNDLSIRIFPQEGETQAPKEESVSSQGQVIPSILHDIVVAPQGDETKVLLVADHPLKDYHQGTLIGREGRPDSLYIDINNVDGSQLVREKQVGTRLAQIRVAPRGSGVRVVFDAGPEGLFPFTITPVPQGLSVTILESAPQDETVSPADTKGQEDLLEVASDPTLDALIDSSEAALLDQELKVPDQEKTAQDMQNSFEFSGYKATRISVDFYKIDLHNVFRLFRQISDINLVVDDSVKGSLTLALTDVPWDFALDIILNLKGLKKVERHNTIVIYPAKKEFIWPQRPSDNLSFEANVEVIEQEALIIQQSTQQTAEIMQAKEFLHQAKGAEQKNNMEQAASLYESAFALWPHNSKIASRLAALYLVDLRINARSIYFAKEALKIDTDNHGAALYAAIASANMDQVPEAMEYFALSINGEPPMAEALISYAAFSEEKGQPEAALKLLERYSDNYSDTVTTMITKARLHDTLGQPQKAMAQYKALLYSGYQLVPELKRYIRERLTRRDNQNGQ